MPEAFSPEVVKKGIYKHFKGRNYRVLHVGMLTGILADAHPVTTSVVIYESEDGMGMPFVRELSEFMGYIQKDSYRGPRFTLLHEDNNAKPSENVSSSYADVRSS